MYFKLRMIFLPIVDPQERNVSSIFIFFSMNQKQSERSTIFIYFFFYLHIANFCQLEILFLHFVSYSLLLPSCFYFHNSGLWLRYWQQCSVKFLWILRIWFFWNIHITLYVKLDPIYLKSSDLLSKYRIS